MRTDYKFGTTVCGMYVNQLFFRIRFYFNNGILSFMD